MIGYFEADDLERAERYLVDRVPDGAPPPLEEIFKLD
jgi:hypothetical protein